MTGFQLGPILPLKHIGQHLATFLLSSGESQNAAKHSDMHRTAPPPKNHPTCNAEGAETEKS